MSSLLIFNQKNAKFNGARKARLIINSFNLIVTINMLTGFYLILISFRHLAENSASLDYVTASLFQAMMLLTLTVAAHLIRNVAGKKLVGITIGIIPWIFIFANSIFSLFSQQF